MKGSQRWPQISKFEWRLEGEEIRETEQNESDDDEEEAAELMIPEDTPAPVIMEVDEESTSTWSIAEGVDDVNAEDNQDGDDIEENIVVTDEEHGDKAD